jgi:hypothetical protein
VGGCLKYVSRALIYENLTQVFPIEHFKKREIFFIGMLAGKKYFYLCSPVLQNEIEYEAQVAEMVDAHG